LRGSQVDRLRATRAIVPIIPPCYPEVVEALAPTMRGLPGVIVTIDGRGGAGKTTLGRYLAWHFNVTLIETDLFLIPAQDFIIHLDDQVNRIIERRLSIPRPVIVEGVAMLQLMARINRTPDFSIYLVSAERAGSDIMDKRLSAYEVAFAPTTKASIVVRVELR
jgi:uridine kinase